MEREPLLMDLWKRKVEEDTGESQQDRDVALFYRFLEDAKSHDSLNIIISELKVAIGRYAQSVIKLSALKTGGLDREAIMSADRHRRLMHNNLIATVNQLSREYRKLGLDNNWRASIIGESREELGDWALVIAREVINGNSR